MADKRGFPFVTFLDPYIVVSPPKVYLCEVPRALEFVTIEDPPIPFSPFSLSDCTMLSHFSFNDFIAIAFPDIARDLDIQI